MELDGRHPRPHRLTGRMMLRGTASSNPAPSSGESRTNHPAGGGVTHADGKKHGGDCAEPVAHEPGFEPADFGYLSRRRDQRGGNPSLRIRRHPEERRHHWPDRGTGPQVQRAYRDHRWIVLTGAFLVSSAVTWGQKRPICGPGWASVDVAHREAKLARPGRPGEARAAALCR